MRGTVLLLLLGGMLGYGCAPMNNNQSAHRTNSDRQIASSSDQTTYIRLADYLRKVPGLSIQGNGDDVRVTIRNAVSWSGNSEPLYVINDQPIGQSYAAAASMVDPNDIKYVRVLKDAVSTAPYGMRGAQGVILIKVKDGSGN